jgi:hypothetical protein
MRYLIFMIFFSFSILFASSSMAQNTNQSRNRSRINQKNTYTYNSIPESKDVSISLGIGQFISNPVSGRSTTHDFYGSYFVRQSSRFSPQLSLNVEANLDKRFQIGIQLHYLALVRFDRKSNEKYPFPSDSAKREQGRARVFGFDFNMKYFLYIKNKTSVYINGSAGLLIVQENVSDPAGVWKPYSDTRLWLLCHLGTGIQYFPHENYGFFAELGYKRLGPPRGLQLSSGVIARF